MFIKQEMDAQIMVAVPGARTTGLITQAQMMGAVEELLVMA